MAVTSSSTAVFYISLVPGTLRGYKIKVTTLNAATGKQNAQIQLSSESEVTDAKSIVHVGSRSSYPIIVWADLTRKTVKANVLGSKSVTTLRVHPEDRIRRATIHAADDRNVPGHFVLHCQTDTRSIASVYLVEDTKVPDRPSHVWELESENAAYAASTVMNEIYFTRHTPSEIAIHSAKSSKPVQTWTIGTSLSEAQEPNGLTQAVIEVAVRAGGKYAMRAGVLYASGDWELTRDGKPQWVRNEGLAGVKAATWAELPNRQDLVRELEVESHTNIVSAYIHRVRRHVNGLSQLQEWARNIPKRIWTSFTGQTLGGQDDGFGFGQVVIAATEKGRVFALDGGRQGAVRWSVLAKPLEDCAVWNITGINVNGTLVTVTAAGGEAVILEVESGKIRERQASGLLPNVRSLVSVNAGLGKNFLMPLSDDGVPMDALKENVGNSTYLVTQRADGSISGWYLASGRSLTPAWTFRPPSGEAVSVATSRPAHDPVASIGRALGDRNVLYKFLSPNLLLVLTSNTALATLTAYLLDSVTGRTLHSTTHHSVDTTEPISATMSENWLAYTFSTDPSLGTVQGDIAAPKAHLLTLSELYESPAPNSRGPLGDSNNVSSLTSPVYSPYVLSSTHVLPAALTHLTTSSTLQGITPRTILAYCPAAAAVFALPYHPFSPRRPRHRDATPEEREEGLLRDHAAMDLFPHWSLSHAREVLGVERVVAAPTRMESSTLVLAFGQLDLFATREAPIGAFDVLDRGFGRWAMVGTVLALAVGTAALAPMVRLTSCLSAPAGCLLHWLTFWHLGAEEASIGAVGRVIAHYRRRVPVI